ncbi:hypothetical protein GGS21DRAFT_526386 [Xylaria nigripes]|nr:hypothetical protein GGS21DRAFT_526386 [Xylaria nigripes]
MSSFVVVSVGIRGLDAATVLGSRGEQMRKCYLDITLKMPAALCLWLCRYRPRYPIVDESDAGKRERSPCQTHHGR